MAFLEWALFYSRSTGKINSQWNISRFLYGVALVLNTLLLGTNQGGVARVSEGSKHDNIVCAELRTKLIL